MVQEALFKDDDNDVMITSGVARFKGTSYPLGAISSVRISPRYYVPPWGSIYLGLFFVGSGIAMLLAAIFGDGDLGLVLPL